MSAGMIGLAALLTAQSVTMAAPPTSAPASATAWQCDFVDTQGARFALKGTFPAVPAGSDPNQPLPTRIEGTGPAQLRGNQGASPFTVGDQLRRFYVIGRDGSAGHYNLMVSLVHDDTGLATINYFRRDPATGGGTMSAYANGDCTAEFQPAAKPEAAKP
jgi:hypothetical protein